MPTTSGGSPVPFHPPWLLPLLPLLPLPVLVTDRASPSSSSPSPPPSLSSPPLLSAPPFSRAGPRVPLVPATFDGGLRRSEGGYALGLDAGATVSLFVMSMVLRRSEGAAPSRTRVHRTRGSRLPPLMCTYACMDASTYVRINASRTYTVRT